MRLILLGVTESGAPLPKGLLALWLITWKLAIIAFTQVATEGARFNADAVWGQALRRFAVRVNAAVFTFRTRLVGADGKGQKRPSPASINRLLEPLAVVGGGGELLWTAPLKAAYTEIGFNMEHALKAVEQPEGEESTLGRPVQFVQAKRGGSSEDEQVSEAPPLVADEARYVWRMTRRLCTSRVKDMVRIHSELSVNGSPDIKLLEAGRYLPAADNGNEDDALATLYGAVRRAEDRMDAALTREQLWVFEVEEQELADMMDRAQEMCAAGLGAFVRVTEVRLGWGRNRIVSYLRKALRQKAILADVYSGPKARKRRATVATTAAATAVAAPGAASAAVATAAAAATLSAAATPSATTPQAATAAAAEVIDEDFMDEPWGLDPFNLEREIEREMEQ